MTKNSANFLGKNCTTNVIVLKMLNSILSVKFFFLNSYYFLLNIQSSLKAAENTALVKHERHDGLGHHLSDR